MKRIYDVILRPLITERGTEMREQGKYLFEVHPTATKQEVKDAIEMIFKKDKVKVVKVRTARLPERVARSSRRHAIKAARWKKAIVTLAPGHKIEIFEGA